MDLTALGVAAKALPRKPAISAVLVFVVGATVLDIFVARGLDETPGRMIPATA